MTVTETILIKKGIRCRSYLQRKPLTINKYHMAMNIVVFPNQKEHSSPLKVSKSSLGLSLLEVGQIQTVFPNTFLRGTTGTLYSFTVYGSFDWDRSTQLMLTFRLPDDSLC